MTINSKELEQLQDELQYNQTIIKDQDDESIQENNQDGESTQQEPVARPQRQRRQTEVLNIDNTNTQSYDNNANINLLTQGIKPDIEYDKQEAVTLATIMMSMVQTYSLRSGIKKFGTRGRQAALEEMNQLHKRACFKPILVETLSSEERSKVLNSLIFLVEKKRC